MLDGAITAALPQSGESAAPAWDQIRLHPKCPLCDYDLFGLAKPRCPECGYPFEWSDVLTPDRERHPFLYEFHPESNVRSYVQTAWHAFFPRSFWQSLRPREKPVLSRLVWYWVIGLVVFMLATALGTPVLGATYYLINVHTFASDWEAISSVFENSLLEPTWWIVSLARTMAIGLLPTVLLPSLIVFRVSMRRARIEPRHILRAIVYSFDPVLFAALATFFNLILVVFPIRPGQIYSAGSIGLILVGLSVFHRLCVGFKSYLRFDHPFLTILASFAISILILLNIYFVVNNW